MFVKGQAVECVDEKMQGVGACLTKGRIYEVEEFIPPEECQELPDNGTCKWNEEGGRVSLVEEQKCFFFGRRFKAVSAK